MQISGDVVDLSRRDLLAKAAAVKSADEAAPYLQWIRERGRHAPMTALALLDGLSRHAAYRADVARLFRAVEAYRPAEYNAYRALHQKVQVESVGRAFDAARRRGRGWTFVVQFAAALESGRDTDGVVGILKALSRGGADARRLAAAVIAVKKTDERLPDALRAILDWLVMDPLTEVWGWAAAAWGRWAGSDEILRHRLIRALSGRAPTDTSHATVVASDRTPTQETVVLSEALLPEDPKTALMNDGGFVDFESDTVEAAKKPTTNLRSPEHRRALAALAALCTVEPSFPIALGQNPKRSAKDVVDEILSSHRSDPYDQASTVLGLVVAADLSAHVESLTDVCRRGVDPCLANLAFVLSERRPRGSRKIAAAVLEAVGRESPRGVPPEHVFSAVRSRDALSMGTESEIDDAEGAGSVKIPEVPDRELEAYLAHRDWLWRGCLEDLCAATPASALGEFRTLALAETLEVGREIVKKDGDGEEMEASTRKIWERWESAARRLVPDARRIDTTAVQDAFIDAAQELHESLTAGLLPQASSAQRWLVARRLWLVGKIMRTGYKIEIKDVSSSRRESATSVDPRGFFRALIGWLKRALENGIPWQFLPLVRSAADAMSARPIFAADLVDAGRDLFRSTWNVTETRHLIPLRRELARLISAAIDDGVLIATPPSDPDMPSLEPLLDHPVFDEKLTRSIGLRLRSASARAEFEKTVRRRDMGLGYTGSAEEKSSGDADSMDRPGWIDGTFEIIRRLGQGGFGVVYECASHTYGSVAVKVFLDALAREAPHHVRFTEAINMAQIAHPNVPRLVAVGDHRGFPYIAIELIFGKNLRDRMRGESLPFDERRSVLRDIAEVLRFAHERGVVHRDLKPENVMIADDGVLKVLDWGMAFAAEIMKRGGRLPGGTHLYSAPEQWSTDAASGQPKVDYFAFGRMAIELLAQKSLVEIVEWGDEKNPSHYPREVLVAAGVPEILIDDLLDLTRLDARDRASSLDPIVEKLERI